MNKKQIISKVKLLDFPTGSYVVFGSCPMAAAGIRESSDIDFLVDESLFDQLKTLGWEQINKGPNDKPLVKGDFEAHMKWNFSSYNPSLKHLLSSAQTIDGIPFASLLEVLKWKTASGRLKDLRDIELINEYLSK